MHMETFLTGIVTIAVIVAATSIIVVVVRWFRRSTDREGGMSFLFDFKGRARRKEFWTIQVLSVIVEILAIMTLETANIMLVALGFLASLFCAVVSIAVYVRRLHDVGRSGKVAALSIALSLASSVTYEGHTRGLSGILFFANLLFGVYVLILMLMDSQAGDNQYGPNPKGVAKRSSEGADELSSHS